MAYGTTARIAKSAIELLEADGIAAGLLRPITLFPYPMDDIASLPDSVEHILVVEMSMGQMIDDVRIANEGRLPIHFVGRTGGMIPTPKLVADTVRGILGSPVEEGVAP